MTAVIKGTKTMDSSAEGASGKIGISILEIKVEEEKKS